MKTLVPLIEVAKSPLRLLMVDLGLGNILESGYLGLTVFTKAFSRRSSSWTLNPRVVSGEYVVG